MGTKREFDVGEWALFGTRIVKVKERHSSGSCSVSDGSIETSGCLDDRLYPLSLQNKACAETVEWHLIEMHKLCRGVNWPDIASLIESELAKASEDTEAQKTLMLAVNELHRELQEIERAVFKAFPGLRVFRR